MEFKSEPQGGQTLITVSGRLDMANAMALEQKLLKEAETSSMLTLDFAGVEYISSAGIRALLSLYRVVQPKGGSVTISNACEQVREILEETEFDELFNM